MHFTFTTERRLEHGILERAFLLGDIPGILWMPEPARAPVPLILLGHQGGLSQMLPRVVPRAHGMVAAGFAAATIEIPGAGGREPLPGADAARSELRAAVQAGEPPTDDVVERLVLPLAGAAAGEARRALDGLLALPELRGPVGYGGGVLGIGVRLAAVEPRIAAVGLFAGSYIPRSMLEEARRVTIPVHMLLQWDDFDNDRRLALDLFDAFGSQEKTLYASLGGHTGVPPWAGEDALRFFQRHVR